MEWLADLKGLDELTDEFLTACAKRLKRYSIHAKALAEPRYKEIALVGLYVLAAKGANVDAHPEADADGAPLRLLPDSLPDELLLCISFAGTIISQALECVVEGELY